MDNNISPEKEQLNFSQEKTPLQKVGAFLKEGRQGRNISIEDLCSSLRIGQEQLIALEKGDEKSLPEKVFIKAMVRRISEKLKLDTKFILEELNGREKSKPIIYKPQFKKEKVIPKNTNINLTQVILLSGLLGLTSSFIFVRYLNSNTKQSEISYSPKELIFKLR